MKIKHVKLYFMTIGIMALQSCSDAGETLINAPGNTVSFSTYVGRSPSRAAIADINTLKASTSGFGVFANWDLGKNWTNGSKQPNFMNNQQVLFSAGAWDYSPAKYWPSNPSEKVSFLAYAPYTPYGMDTSEMPDTDKSTVIMAGHEESYGIIAVYQLGSDITKQDDFLYASAFDQSSATSQVSFDFKHALAKIGFKMTGWQNKAANATTTVTVNGISLSTELGCGFFSLETGKWVGIMNGDDTKAFIVKGDLLQNTSFTNVDGHSGQLNTEDGYIFTLPSINGLNHQYCLMLDYTIETLDASLPEGKVTSRNKVYRYISPELLAGKSYTININLGFDGNSGEDDGDNGDNPGYGTPDPVDPNPEDPTVPTEPTGNTAVKFTVSVGNWDGTTEPNIPMDN